MDPGFTVEGDLANPPGDGKDVGVPRYDFAKFSKKNCVKLRKILLGGARCVLGAPLDPRHYLQKECIPVGCIPSAAVAVLGRGVST